MTTGIRRDVHTDPLLGIPVVACEWLPYDTVPDHCADARRLVRHGMADVLEWLGQDVGPEPGEITTTRAMTISGVLFIGDDDLELLRSRAR